MLKHIISLVFLSIYLSYLPALSDTNLKILPKQKPKILLNKNVKKINIILPEKKPNIDLKKNVSNKWLLPKEKPIDKEIVKNINTNNEKILKDEKDKDIKSTKIEPKDNIISSKLDNQFIFPQKMSDQK